MLAIIHKNVPELDNFKTTIKNSIDIIDNDNLRIKSTYDILSNQTYSRIALIWDNNDSNNKIPMVSRVRRLATKPKNRNKPYQNNELFSTDLRNLLSSIQTNNGGELTVDLITCNLNSATFVSYINQYMLSTGITVNYSIDKTGNPHHGGDWIMESNGENIKDIYFTSAIEDYQYLLVSNRLTVTGANNSTLVLTAASYSALALSDDGYTFTGNKILIGESFTWSANDYIYINNNGNNQVTINGQNNTLTINTDTTFNGLVKCYNNSNVIVKNLTVAGVNDELSDDNGWIIQSMDSNSNVTLEIGNCHASGDLDTDYCGGIIGEKCAYNEGNVYIYDCSFSGSIGDNDGGGADGCGGIVGQDCCNNEGTVTIKNCYSTGRIRYQGGGICGEYAGEDSGSKLYIYDCYSTGDITGDGAGGIVGEDCGYDGGHVYINNCYSTGDISGENAGGIAGYYVGSDDDAKVYITNCYSTGDISGRYAGGIIGSEVGEDYDCTVEISNCFSTGEISGDDAGGISGYYYPGSSATYRIINCFSTGEISGDNAGGITGSSLDYCEIYSCYSTGNITGDSAGGIVGNNCNSGVSLYGCYSTGTVSGSNAGGICGDSSRLNIIENCYSVRSEQTDIDSNTYIDGSNDSTLLSTTLPNNYGYVADSVYPKLKVFTRAPWSSYTNYNSVPTRNNSEIDINNSLGKTIFSIDSLYENLRTALSSYKFIISNNKNELTNRPYNMQWTFEIYELDGSDNSTNMTLANLPVNTQNTIISELNSFYQDKIDASVSFALENGSVLASMIDLACFDGDSLVQTNQGWKKAKELTEDDEIFTHQRKSTKIIKIGKFKNSRRLHLIKKGSITRNLPFRDMIISEGHKIMIKGKWTYPRDFAPPYYPKEPIELYHIQTENYDSDTLVVNGMILEIWKNKS